MTRTSPLRTATIALLFIAALFVVHALGVAIAHADPVATPPPPVDPGWSFAEILAFVALLLAGTHVTVDGLRAVLKFSAPRTPTTLDDRALVRLDAFHDRLVQVESVIAEVVPKPQSFPAPKVVTLLLFCLLGAAALQPACGPVTNAGHAVVDCTKADQSALIAAANRLMLAPGWDALENEAISAGVTIGGCALLAVIDQYRAPRSMAAAPAPDPHEVVERVRARFGGVTWQTVDGPR